MLDFPSVWLDIPPIFDRRSKTMTDKTAKPRKTRARIEKVWVLGPIEPNGSARMPIKAFLSKEAANEARELATDLANSENFYVEELAVWKS